MNYYLDENGTLYHHGILGQKWGKRNGPPYPLDSSRVSASEKKEGWKESKYAKSDNNSTSDRNKSNVPAGSTSVKNLDKNTVGMGAEAAELLFDLSLLAIMVAVPYIQKKRIYKKMDKTLESNKEGKDFKEIPKLDKEETPEESAANVNPRFKSGDMAYAMNCTMCTTAYDMRQRGYDVTAEGITTGVTSDRVAKWYNLTESDLGHDYDYRKFKAQLQAMPEGSRGNVMTEVGAFSSLHSMAWEKRDGKVRIIDAQTNTIYNSIDESIINSYSNYGYKYFRTDNATINEQEILSALKYNN